MYYAGLQLLVDHVLRSHDRYPEVHKLRMSIKNYVIPEEFAEDGAHTILIAAAEPIPEELLSLRHK
ncbi:hypothetical protein MKX03_008986, partial [Papaver bracteatum]